MAKFVLSMKKWIFLFVFSLSVLTLFGCDKKEEFKENTVYMFWQPGCSHCHHAIDFFKSEGSDIKIEMFDVSKEEGNRKLLIAMKLFNLGNQIGTPLFIMNGKHVMGWSEKIEGSFKEIDPVFKK